MSEQVSGYSFTYIDFDAIVMESFVIKYRVVCLISKYYETFETQKEY